MKKLKPYYRKITESLPHVSEITPHFLSYLTFLASILSVLFLFLTGMLLLKYLELKDQKLRNTDNLAYWESVVVKHPNFTEGYYNAGYYSYALGDRFHAIQFLDKAIELDPGYKKAIELERVISK